MPPTLYVTVGLSSSGKSTWRKEQLPNATVLSPDNWIEENYRNWTPERATYAWAATYRSLGRAIVNEMWNADSNTAEYVWDAKNLTPKDRSAVLNIAKGAGWQVVMVYFDVPLEVCVARLEARKDRDLPMNLMEYDYSVLTPPQDYEPFDGMIVIKYGVDQCHL